MSDTWAVKVFYLGLHDEIAIHEVKVYSEGSATDRAASWSKDGAWWKDDDDRLVLIPVLRVLRVEVYQSHWAPAASNLTGDEHGLS